MMIRNGVSFPPSLNSGMVAVPQGSSQRPDASPVCDDLLVGHVRLVRSERTAVKSVDCVLQNCDNAGMGDIPTTGEILSQLRERSGMTLEEISEAGGYRTKSGVQEFFKPFYTRPLATGVAKKLALAMAGKGTPPITVDEIYALTGVMGGTVEPNGVVQKFEGASDQRMRQALPIYGTAASP